MISICAVRLRPLFESETSCLSPGTGHHSNTILSYSRTTSRSMHTRIYIYIYNNYDSVAKLWCVRTKDGRQNQLRITRFNLATESDYIIYLSREGGIICILLPSTQVVGPVHRSSLRLTWLFFTKDKGNFKFWMYSRVVSLLLSLARTSY